MLRLLSLAVTVVMASAMCLGQANGQKPEAPAKLPVPSEYPTSWQFKFDYAKPARIVVELPGKGAPQAYWYLPYTVTNNTGQERMFLPVFELVGPDGKIYRSDKNVPARVIDAIRVQQGNKFIESSVQAAGELRLGAEEAKYGVAVWPEPTLRMGHFEILIGGLSGEFQKVKSPSGEDVLLRKTLQLNFAIPGDEVYPGEDAINEKPSEWIMR